MPGVCRTGEGFGGRGGIHGKRGQCGAAARADYEDSVRRAVEPWPCKGSRVTPQAGSVPGAGAASEICDGDGHDHPFALAAEALRGAGAAAVEAGGPESVGGLDIAGRSGPSRLGADGEVLRQPESGLPDSNHAARMAAAGRRTAAWGVSEQTDPADQDGRPEAAGE